MKISVNTNNADNFAFLKKCGFDACDFQLGILFSKDRELGNMNAISHSQIEETFTAIRERAEAVSFEIGQTHSAFSGHPRHYNFDMDDIVKRQIASIKATHYLGSKHCVVHPIITPGRHYDKLTKKAFDESVDFYKRLTDTLEEYDVYCCIENMWVCDPVYKHICSTILSHAEEMVDMCDVLGDRFKICIDTGHGLLTQDAPAEMVRICKDKLACLHTHDNDGILDLHAFPFLPCGKPYGTSWEPIRMDWTDFMKALDEVDYRGNLNFEIALPCPEPLRGAALRYLAEIAKYLISQREIQY
jgi:sugar phosphate isomerase/epimerase